jgi:hypothetical protein
LQLFKLCDIGIRTKKYSDGGDVSPDMDCAYTDVNLRKRWHFREWEKVVSINGSGKLGMHMKKNFIFTLH